MLTWNTCLTILRVSRLCFIVWSIWGCTQAILIIGNAAYDIALKSATRAAEITALQIGKTATIGLSNWLWGGQPVTSPTFVPTISKLEILQNIPAAIGYVQNGHINALAVGAMSLISHLFY
eukprot:1279111-Karenia_brevis.AAC.1